MASPHLVPIFGPLRPTPAASGTRGTAAAKAVLTEIWRYLSGSQRSLLRQADAVQELDDRLRRDIGLPARPAPRRNDWPGHGW